VSLDFNDFDDEWNDEDDLLSEEDYPDFYLAWDKVLSANEQPHFVESEELVEIIDIYFSDNEVDKAKLTMEYALQWHPKDEDMISDLLALLNDFERWNDLLTLAEQYKDMHEVWADGHKLSALLHLGMEEDTFLFFQHLKKKYKKDKDNLTIIYCAMTEALQEVDLFLASVNVMEEAMKILGTSADFYWMQLQAYLSLENKEESLKVAGIIEKIDPMEAEVWYRLGSVYMDLEEPGKAIDAFEFADTLGYEKKHNYLGLISAYEKNGNLQRALEKTKEYLRLYPDNHLINVLAAGLCSEMEKWEDAIRYIDKAIVTNPELSSLYLYKSGFYANMGDMQKAINTLKTGIKKTNDRFCDLNAELEKLQNQSTKE
jgi:tetratricopeptide (TPR) repeat protein